MVIVEGRETNISYKAEGYRTQFTELSCHVTDRKAVASLVKYKTLVIYTNSYN